MANKIKVVELFAGVGGFRIGLEGASDAYETIWNNQWEPSMVHRDRYVGSLVFRESLLPVPMIQQSLPEYVPVRLNMFNTHCDTTLGRIMYELK